MPDYTDSEVIRLYREWSELTWASGFYRSSPAVVGHFRRWLTQQVSQLHKFKDYELEMLAEFRKQESEDSRCRLTDI